ncbi:MAG: glycosyltransferase family 4 protein [Rhodospirillales bacterium]|nr:glycosyltransferase family 4 protein [Rhodospirillales bacterium]
MLNNVVIIQRVVPHYRFALFERLWREFGWRVATTNTAPEVGSLKFNQLINDEHPFIKRYDFKFTSKTNPYACRIPLRRILDDTGATAVISEFSMRMSTTYELPMLRRLRGSPTVLFWSHGFNMSRGLLSAYQRLVQVPGSLLNTMVDGHVCYSEEGRDFLAAYMARDRLFVAPNTIDAESLQAQAAGVQAMTPPGRPHIVTVGRATEDKDFPRLVRIFRALLADHPEAALTLVGDGPDMERTRAAAGDELGRRIFMPGAEYDEARIAAYYGSADFSVLSGAAGLGVNHALCYGVPVVAYARTEQGPHHHPEIAYVIDGKTGMQVPRYTDEAMLQALRDFLSAHPRPREAFAASISRYVANHLSLDSMIREFARVDDFISRRSQSRQKSADGEPAAATQRGG